jgi:hypothetical protein
MVVIVRAATRRYAVRRADLAGIKRAEAAPVGTRDAERPFASVALGPLLEHAGIANEPAPQALLVSLRRRTVALLVERVEEFLEQPQVHPLPGLLREHLQHEWSAGVVEHDDELVVLLDLRAVARSVLLRDKQESQRGLALAEKRESQRGPALSEKRESQGGPALPEQQESQGGPALPEQRESQGGLALAEKRESQRGPALSEKRESQRGPALSEDSLPDCENQ